MLFVLFDLLSSNLLVAGQIDALDYFLRTRFVVDFHSFHRYWVVTVLAFDFK
jgi:hypothetical protein